MAGKACQEQTLQLIRTIKKIKDVKSFITLAPESDVLKLFTSVHSKQEFLSLASLSSLV
jgi:hypothetical protein